MADLIVRVDATTAQFDAAMVSAQKATLRYEATLKTATKAQAQFDAAVASSGASSEEAAIAQAKLTKSLERVTVAETQAGIAAKRASEIQSASAAKAAAAAEASAAKQAAAQRKLGSVAGGIGLAAAAGLGLAAKAASDFNAKMAQVASISKASASQVAALAEATHGYANIGVSASEAADAEIELIKAGVGVKDILSGALTGTLNAAAAGQIDVAQATEIASAAMVQFGLAGKDIPHVADLLAAGADKSLGGISDLGEGLKAVGTTAHQFGLTIDETVGALSEFAAAGLTGSLGGTALKQAILKLEAPSAKAAGLMDQYGISLYKANGQQINLAELAGQLQTAFKGVSAESRNAALATIFGSRAVQAANILYKDGTDKVNDWTNKVNDAGFAADQAAGKMDSLQGDLQKLGAELQNSAIDFGQQLQPALRAVTQDLASFVGLLDDLPDAVKEAAALTLAFTAAVGLGTFVYTRATAALASMGATLGIVAKESTAAAAGMEATTAATGLLNTKMLLLRGGAAVAGIGLLTVSSNAKDVSQALGVATTAAAGAALGFSVGGPLGAALGGGVALVSAYVSALGDLSSTLDGLRSAAAGDPFNFADISTAARDAADSLDASGESANRWSGYVQAIPVVGTYASEALGHFASSADDASVAAAGLAAQSMILKDNVALFAHDFLGVRFDAPFRLVNVAINDAIPKLRAAGLTMEQIVRLMGTSAGQQRLANILNATADATGHLGKAAGDAADQVEHLTAAQRALNSVFATAIGSQAALTLAIHSSAEETKNLSDVMNPAGTAISRTSVAGATLIQSLSGIAQTASEVTGTAKEQGRAIDAARAAIISQAEAAGASVHAATALANGLLDASAAARAAAASVRAAQAAIDALHSKTIEVQINTELRTSFTPGGHTVVGQAEGGPVRGPGGPKDDRVLRALSNGEWVIREAVSSREGPAKMAALNAGRATIVPMASGGSVGGQYARSMGGDWGGGQTVIVREVIGDRVTLVTDSGTFGATVRREARGEGTAAAGYGAYLKRGVR